jgi:glutathione S-transferase
MKRSLYVIPVSHSAIAARLMLEYKGIAFETVRLTSGLHPIQLRALGFRGGTVPALRCDRTRVQGSLAISRYLEGQIPTPPLFPGDSDERARVEAAESWGADVLQEIPRRLVRWALVRSGGLRRFLAERNHLPVPGVSAHAMIPVAMIFARASRASDENVRLHLAELPSVLDRVDDLLRTGVIGASRRNAATYQIAPSVRLLMNVEQLAPLFRDRPAARFATEVVPRYEGLVPRVFPQGWVTLQS